MIDDADARLEVRRAAAAALLLGQSSSTSRLDRCRAGAFSGVVRRDGLRDGDRLGALSPGLRQCSGDCML